MTHERDDEASWLDDWHGAKLGGSETELYTATANTIDRIKEVLVKEGMFDGMAVQAVIFAVLTPTHDMLLWQSGEVVAVYNLAHAAAQQAVASIREAEEEAGRDHRFEEDGA